MLTNDFSSKKQQFGINHHQLLHCFFFATVVGRTRAPEQNSIPQYHIEKQLFPVLLDSNPIIMSARNYIHQLHPLYCTCLGNAQGIITTVIHLQNSAPSALRLCTLLFTLELNGYPWSSNNICVIHLLLYTHLKAQVKPVLTDCVKKSVELINYKITPNQSQELVLTS